MLWAEQYANHRECYCYPNPCYLPADNLDARIDLADLTEYRGKIQCTVEVC